MKYYIMTNGIMKDEDGQFIPSEINYIMREDGALIPCVNSNQDYLDYLNDSEKVVEDFDYEAENERQTLAIEQKEAEDLQEALIQEKIREFAIAELIKEGKINP